MTDSLPISDAQTKIYGTMLPERVVQEVLKVGFSAIKNDTSIIQDLFHKLDNEALTDIEEYYKTHSVAVRTNFPKDDFTWPIVAVVSSSDNEDPSLDSMGEFYGESLSVARTELTQVLGHTCQSTLNIYCLSGNDSNAALWLYYIVKALLIAHRLTFISHGMINQVVSGQDIQLREEMFPEFTYARVVALSFTNNFTIRLSDRIAAKLEVMVFSEDTETGIKTLLSEEA